MVYEDKHDILDIVEHTLEFLSFTFDKILDAAPLYKRGLLHSFWGNKIENIKYSY